MCSTACLHITDRLQLGDAFLCHTLLGNRRSLLVSAGEEACKVSRRKGSMNIATPPSLWNSTGCCLSVNKVFNMQKSSLASPGFSSTMSATGPLGCVTGNIYTQLLITDKWVDKLPFVASPFSPIPGFSTLQALCSLRGISEPRTDRVKGTAANC